MTTAQSTLDTLLRMRQHRRDVCRLRLVELELRDRALRSQQEATAHQRESELSELRSLESSLLLDVAASAARRRHLEQLTGDLQAQEQRRQELGRQIAEQSERLLRSDREVQSLEKLLEGKTAEATAARRKWESRELDEAWRAPS